MLFPWVSANTQHDGENNFLRQHKYDASSNGDWQLWNTPDRLGLKIVFMPFNGEARPLAFFSPSSRPFMVSVSHRCLHLIRVSMSITHVLKNTLKWAQRQRRGRVGEREKERGTFEGKKKPNKVLWLDIHVLSTCWCIVICLPLRVIWQLKLNCY